MRPAALTVTIKRAGLLAVTVLAACGTDGPLRLPAIGAGLAAGTGQATSGSSAASSTATQAGSASVQVGRKQVELAAVELDPGCKRLVTPFEPSENVTELVTLGAEMGSQAAMVTAGEYLQNLLSQKPTRSSTVVEVKRGLPMSLRRAALRMNWLPMSLEVMVGRRELDGLQAEGRLLTRTEPLGKKFYPQADALLAEVLTGVKEAYPYTFSIFISKNSGENAEALPGGLILIDKALIETDSLRDKAYFALSHEVAHVLQRHQTRALQARVIDALALGASLPDLIKTIHQTHSEPMAVVQLVVGGKLLFEKHAESQELQSDACAVRVLDTALANDRRLLAAVQGFVNGLPKRLELPAAAAAKPNGIGEVTKLVDLVSRPVDAHPTTEERGKNLQAVLSSLRERPANAKSAGPLKPAAKPAPLPSVIKPKAG